MLLLQTMEMMPVKLLPFHNLYLINQSYHRKKELPWSGIFLFFSQRQNDACYFLNGFTLTEKRIPAL